MKKSTIIIFLVIVMLKIQAQDYLISFTASGGSTVIGTVIVDNLTKETSVTLNGGDILHLTGGAGIGTKDMNTGNVQIYPNPMTERSMLTFIAPENGNATIGIVDLSGKTVCQTSTLLTPGAHSFHISGISQGMYFVKVTGNNYNYCSKLLSKINLRSEGRIEYVSCLKIGIDNQSKNVAATIDMPYTDGDQLLFKGVSGIYTTIVADVPVSSKTITFNFVDCTDNEGKNYAIVQIGTLKSVVQTWMAENLNYQTGNSWCYDTNTSNCNVYGRLYDWQTALMACPSGWHLPSDVELTALTDFLGGESMAGGKMKETGTTHWLSPNTEATNSSGFNALPGGNRYFNGDFSSLAGSTYFWSLTENASADAWYLLLGYNYERVYLHYGSKSSGFSVRCIKD